jgi:hypothetical protein
VSVSFLERFAVVFHHIGNINHSVELRERSVARTGEYTCTRVTRVLQYSSTWCGGKQEHKNMPPPAAFTMQPVQNLSSPYF